MSSAAGEGAPARGRLRVGVLCDAADHLEAWQLQCLEALLALPGVELCALVVDLEARPRRQLPVVAPPSCLARRGPLPLGPDTALVVWGEEAAEELLHAAAPDLLLCFNFDALDERLVRLPPLGTWCFGHDASARAGDAPPCRAELAGGDRVQYASLLRLSAPRAGGVLREGVMRAVRSSFALHVDRTYAEAARWPAELCRAWLAGLPLPEPDGERVLAPSQRPGALALWALVFRMLGRRLRRSAARRLRAEEWGVGIVRRPLPSLLSGASPPEIEWLAASPAASFRADPFGLRSADRCAVFFEEWDETLGHGRIAAAPVDDEGRAGRAVPIFAAPHHLSYPYVFEHEGVVHAVLESSAVGEVALYRCEGSPLRRADWVRVATLLDDTPVVDATLFPHAGRWWLWCTDADGDAASRLRLFMAEMLEGPWREHPRSPLKTDVRSARPAGTPFVHAGALYRPAQDCSEGYGGAAVILRVDSLSDKEYAETPVARIAPDPTGPYPDGLHTLAAFGDWTLVDGKRWAPRGIARLLAFRRRSWR